MLPSSSSQSPHLDWEINDARSGCRIFIFLSSDSIRDARPVPAALVIFRRRGRIFGRGKWSILNSDLFSLSQLMLKQIQCFSKFSFTWIFAKYLKNYKYFFLTENWNAKYKTRFTRPSCILSYLAFLIVHNISVILRYIILIIHMYLDSGLTTLYISSRSWNCCFS